MRFFLCFVINLNTFGQMRKYCKLCPDLTIVNLHYVTVLFMGRIISAQAGRAAA